MIPQRSIVHTTFAEKFVKVFVGVYLTIDGLDELECSLFWLAARAREAIVQEPKINVDCMNDSNEAPFYRAVWNLYVEEMKLLLSQPELDMGNEDDRENPRRAMNWHRR